MKFHSSGNLQKVIYTSSIENPYFWQGNRWEGDLYYWQARYYSPSLGRFVSQDPQGIVDSMNLYLFVKNNPSSYVDPSGEVVDTIWDAGWVTYDGIRLLNNTKNIFTDVIITSYGFVSRNNYLYEEGKKLVISDFEERSGLMHDFGMDGAAFIVPFVPARIKEVGNVINKVEETKGVIRTMIEKLFSKMDGVKKNIIITKQIKTIENIDDLVFDKHIIDEMVNRGWTKDKIYNAVKESKLIKNSIDKKTGELGLAYYIGKNQYVVVNKYDGRVIQISDLNDLNWKNDFTHY